MFARLMSDIAECLPEGGQWCNLEKAQTLASIILATRPRVVCEIGVWTGGSFIPMAMALRTLRDLDEREGRPSAGRRAIAIDAWSKSESVTGQEGADADWWSSVDHGEAMRTFVTRVDRHELGSLCEVVRSRSDTATVPSDVGLLHVDGNHADQAVRDVARFGPSVVPGGVLVLDDLGWAGGHVARAHEQAREMGFHDLFPLGTGVVMQRLAARRD